MGVRCLQSRWPFVWLRGYDFEGVPQGQELWALTCSQFWDTWVLLNARVGVQCTGGLFVAQPQRAVEKYVSSKDDAKSSQAPLGKLPVPCLRCPYLAAARWGVPQPARLRHNRGFGASSSDGMGCQ